MEIAKRLPYLALLLLVPLLMGSSQNVPKKLTVGTPNWTNSTPLQIVRIDGAQVGFKAEVGLCSQRQE